MRLPGRRSVLGIVHDIDAAQLEAAADRLTRAYAAIPALEPAQCSSRYFPALRAGVVTVAPTRVDLHAGKPIVWGAPVGPDGLATDEEIDAALTDPARARALAGVFVIVRLGDTGIRAVTSSAYMATLRRSGSAFATRATAAALLAGGRVEVNRDAVAEVVVWQAALGAGGEAVAGVVPLEEASVVDIAPAAPPSVRSYWPLADRLAPGPPTTPHSLRAAVGERVAGLAKVDEAMLGLTGGLDSTLAASALAERGGSIETFTMGHPSYPDLRAAQAVTSALGWAHETVPVTDATGRATHRSAAAVPGGNHVDWLVAHAPWGDGLGHPRDAILGHARWQRSDVLWVSGHGGEVLRSVYGSAEQPVDGAGALTDRLAGWAPESVQAAFTATLRDQLAAATAAGRPADALDVVYVRRQFTWMDRPLPLRQFADVHPVFLDSDIVRAMLDAPLSERSSGAFIRQAHDLGAVNLSDIARRGAAHRPWQARVLRKRWQPYVDDWPLLHRLITALEPDGLLARDVLGEKWWQWATATAPGQPRARGCLWNAIAIESLHRWN